MHILNEKKNFLRSPNSKLLRQTKLKKIISIPLKVRNFYQGRPLFSRAGRQEP
jgi:hypothetical protein